MKYAYAGIHWPNGPEDYDRIMALPSDLLLMLATEARFHYDKVRKAGKTVIWRALPRVGKRPAEIGYKKLDKNAEEAVNLWDEQPHYGEEWFVPYNELDLNFERGDDANDFEDVQKRYETLTKFLEGIYPKLRKLLPESTNILFPPWTPDHGDIEFSSIWKSAADKYDGLVVHAYNDPEMARKRLVWYLTTFPDKPLFVGEWNSAQPEEFLQMLKEVAAQYPNFKGSTYFIWHWYDSPSWWPNEYNIDEREELYTMFKNASNDTVEDSPLPTEPPAPTFIWPKEPNPWSRDDIISRSNREADKLGIPRRVLLGLLITESTLSQFSSRFAYRNQDGSYTNLTEDANAAIRDRDRERLERILQRIQNSDSQDVSFGVGQQTVRWASEGDRSLSVENVLHIRNLYFDPEHAITVAGRQIAAYYRTYKDELEALCRYNKPQLEGKDNPNRAKYVRGLAKSSELLSTLKDATVTTTFIDKGTPNVEGTFSRPPKGFILHGSRSGVAGRSKAIENAGCANWCLVNPEGLAWHASIGENEVYVHMKANEWGWNARAASKNYIAVEFAQATVDEPITDAQVDAFVAYVNQCVLPVYPNMPMLFVTHADVEQSGETGQKDGKTDVFPAGSLDATILKQKIAEKLAPSKPSVSTFSFQFGFKDKADQLGVAVVGQPLENETYLGAGFSYQTTTKGIMFYSKEAGKVTFVPGL